MYDLLAFVSIEGIKGVEIRKQVCCLLRCNATGEMCDVTHDNREKLNKIFSTNKPPLLCNRENPVKTLCRSFRFFFFEIIRRHVAYMDSHSCIMYAHSSAGVNRTHHRQPAGAATLSPRQ